jgi:hypothetical protein
MCRIDTHNEVRLAVCSLSGDAPFSTYETAIDCRRRKNRLTLSRHGPDAIATFVEFQT